MTQDATLPSANALHHRPFVFYWLATGATAFAVQIMSVSVGWQIYDITRNPLHLGYIGLAQFLPPLLLVLVTGLVADRLSRRAIVMTCLGIEALCALGLLAFTLSHPTGVMPVFGILVVLGALGGAVAAWVAAQSGEQLAARVGEPADHAKWGDRLVPLAFAFGLITLFWYVAQRRSESGTGAGRP